MYKREIYQSIWQELSRDKAMIFLSGPHQSGKTTLARMIAETFANSLYFNWDIPDHRKDLIADPFFFERVRRKDTTTPLIILDEIHKFSDWKNYLKGVYDKFSGEYRFLVSGSGRLDIYQRGGDSLTGRYLLFHLWPLTLAELANRRLAIKDFLRNPLQTVGFSAKVKAMWDRLERQSGFPEPYSASNVRSYRRWSNTYSRQLIREDLRDLTGVKSIYQIETLYHLLPDRAGSPLSIPSLSRDLKVAYNSISSWLQLFERFYLAFAITPWTTKISRAILKERKAYIWDVPRINDEAARFENMVALELYRAVTLWSDLGYGQFSLHFVRDKEKREVDFIIACDRKPVLMVETKLADTEPAPSLSRFQNILNVPAVQLVRSGETFQLVGRGEQKLLIVPAWMWLPVLP